MIELRASGPLTSVQDRGRDGHRRLGVPRSGVLVPAWMAIANALVGNAPNDPVLECFEGGLRLASGERALRVAFAGDVDAALVDGAVRRTLAPWRSHRVPPGAELALRGTGRARVAVLAVRGLAVPPTLGSAATCARVGLGGLAGRALADGDRLPLDETAEEETRAHDLGCAPFALPEDAPRLRAVPGPQHDAFTDETLERFFASEWTLSNEVDRMGARLEGPTLSHRDETRRDIVSDAIVPGSVQVPGSGQPIVMLADAHTAGGYPKIATVASADLPVLAIHRPGTRLRLERVDVDAAIARARAAERALERHLASLAPLPPEAPDTERLLAHNLIDGVTDGAVERRVRGPAAPDAGGRTVRTPGAPPDPSPSVTEPGHR